MTVAQSLVALGVRIVTGARPIVTSSAVDARPATVLDLPTPAVFFANHSSHLDFLTIWAILPGRLRRQARPVAAADYWGSGARGRIATRLFNPYLVDRGKGEPTAPSVPGSPRRSQVAGMLEVLDAGDSLIIFPEGTRGDGRSLAAFQAGIARIARARPNVPLVPVALANLGRILPKGGLVPVPLLGTATFLEPVTIGVDESDDDFLIRMRQLIERALPDPEAEAAEEIAADQAAGSQGAAPASPESSESPEPPTSEEPPA